MSALGTLLMLLCLLLGARFDFADRGAGMFGALIWAIITAVGAYLNFTSKGGDIKEFGDMDKLKASFPKPDDTPPPPTPPPAT